MLPMIVIIGLGLRWLARVKSDRISRIGRRLEGQGFKVSVRPTLPEKLAWGAPLAHLTGALALGPGPSGIEWFAEYGRGPAKILIFEHEYITGAVKTQQAHPHTVIAWPAQYPELRDGELPLAEWFIMARHHPWVRRKVRPRELKEPALAGVARQWSLFGAPETARRFLTPGAQVELARAPHGEAWCVGTGWICSFIPHLLDDENVERFLTHVRSMVT